MTEPRVAIIVLNYNGKDCLPSCLRALTAPTYKNKEIILVDNASVDGSFERAEADFPEVLFLKNTENKGFSGGMNQGIREALARGAKWIWLFNYDAIPERDSLSLLLSVAQKHPTAGLLSPRITNEAGDTWFSGGRINFFRMRAEHRAPRKKKTTPYQSEFLTGCAMLIKRDVFEQIGFLDEAFFLYYEDADFSLRARKAGFSAWVVPEATVIHLEVSQKSSQKPYFLVLSGLIFFARHTPAYLRPYLFAYATIRRAKNLVDVWLGREAAPIVHKAYADFSRLRKAKKSNTFPRFR